MMKLATLKEFAPFLAITAALVLISTVVHAARVDAPAPGKARPMQNSSCSPTPPQPPGQ